MILFTLTLLYCRNDMLTQIKMKKVGILIILILGFWSCEKSFIEPTSTCVNDASIVVNENHPKGAKLQAKIEEYIVKGIPGMTILINDDNGFWINSGGFADIENPKVFGQHEFLDACKEMGIVKDV